MEEEGGCMNWEVSIDIYTLPCVKQTANRKVRGTTGSSVQCPVMTEKVGMGVGRKIQEGGDICIPTADSQCHTGETNTTVYSNYLSIKIVEEIQLMELMWHPEIWQGIDPARVHKKKVQEVVTETLIRQKCSCHRQQGSHHRAGASGHMWSPGGTGGDKAASLH